MSYSLKDKTSKGKDIMNDAKTAWKSLVQLVEALSLITVSVVAIYASYHLVKANTWPQLLILFPAAVIALRGATEFLKYLARKEG